MADAFLVPFKKFDFSKKRARSVKGLVYPHERTSVGYLAGDHPSGLTQVDGAPASAKIRIFLRSGFGKVGDGALITTKTSNVDGTWRVSGLNPLLKYDVICQYAGYNDLIWTNVTPEIE